MLDELLQRLNPYLELTGSNLWLQAAAIIVVSLLIAWVFNRFISSALRNLVARTRLQFDDQLIDLLHNPIYFSVILLGIALAVKVLQTPATFDFFIFSSLATIAYLVWTSLGILGSAIVEEKSYAAY